MEKQRLGIECKQYMAKEIKERFEKSPYLFISSFSAMAVPDQEELRRKLREAHASLVVVKNRIAKNVFKELHLASLSELLKGVTAIALGGEESLKVSKALVDFARKNENFKIMGGYFCDQPIDANSIKQLASIPSKETLLRQILCGFQSPIQGFVNTLSATIKGFVVILNRIKEKQE